MNVMSKFNVAKTTKCRSLSNQRTVCFFLSTKSRNIQIIHYCVFAFCFCLNDCGEICREFSNDLQFTSWLYNLSLSPSRLKRFHPNNKWHSDADKLLSLKIFLRWENVHSIWTSMKHRIIFPLRVMSRFVEYLTRNGLVIHMMFD